MLIVNTDVLQDRKIESYHGMVVGSTILGMNIVKDVFANFRDVFGGRSNTYEQGLEEAKNIVLKEMQEQAQKMGANAIIGVKYSFATVGAQGSMLMVNGVGTAVSVVQ